MISLRYWPASAGAKMGPRDFYRCRVSLWSHKVPAYRRPRQTLSEDLRFRRSKSQSARFRPTVTIRFASWLFVRCFLRSNCGCPLWLSSTRAPKLGPPPYQGPSFPVGFFLPSPTFDLQSRSTRFHAWGMHHRPIRSARLALPGEGCFGISTIVGCLANNGQNFARRTAQPDDG